MLKNFAIASDHAGFALKKFLLENLPEAAQVVDYGCNLLAEKVDYCDYAIDICKVLEHNKYNFAVLICGSGIGMSIAANRFKEARAALCVNQEMAYLARWHNDANILVLGAKFVTSEEALAMCKVFFTTKFSNEARHINRLKKIAEINNNVQ